MPSMPRPGVGTFSICVRSYLVERTVVVGLICGGMSWISITWAPSSVAGSTFWNTGTTSLAPTRTPGRFSCRVST